jgi:hypothetical protein
MIHAKSSHAEHQPFRTNVTAEIILLRLKLLAAVQAKDPINLRSGAAYYINCYAQRFQNKTPSGAFFFECDFIAAQLNAFPLFRNLNRVASASIYQQTIGVAFSHESVTPFSIMDIFVLHSRVCRRMINNLAAGLSLSGGSLFWKKTRRHGNDK